MNVGVHDNLLLMGKVLRPHGLEGLLRIASYAESERSFLVAGKVYLQLPSGSLHEEEVLSVRPHKGGYLMRLKGLSSIQDAEIYPGASIFVPKEAIGSTQEGEYFWHEIIGLGVYLSSGKYIGEVRHILPTGGSDVYVVGMGDSEIFIPATHEVVESIDIPGKRMIISEVEGLLDLNEA